MFELLLVGLPLLILGILAVVVLGTLLSVVGFVITLPFRILGALLGFVGWLLALPFALLFGVLGFVGLVLGLVLGGVFLLLPLAPLLLLGALVFWLVRRGRHSAVRS